MDKKICVKCSTENEGNYVFCKYCGAMLPVVDKRYNYPLEEENVSDNITEPSIGGVPLSEMSLYIEKNPHKFIPKFIRMETAKQKVSFCGPVLLFGLLFGFFGTAVWFFWRKMTKLAWLITALGILMLVADTFINFGAYSSYMDGVFSLLFDIAKNPQSYSDPAVINEATTALISSFEQNFDPIISLISRYVGNLILPSVASLFAMYLYKNKAISDIKRIKLQSENTESAKSRIAQKGGCSGVMLLIPILTQIFAPIITFIICLF